jgi:anti-sigma regulatory factor (Ser/Thr protein kinase)
MKNRKEKFKLDFPGKREYLSSACLTVSGIANQAEFSVKEIQELKKAFFDATKIALDNAYANGQSEPHLTVFGEREKGQLKLTIQNEDFKIALQKKHKR